MRKSTASILCICSLIGGILLGEHHAKKVHVIIEPAAAENLEEAGLTCAEHSIGGKESPDGTMINQYEPAWQEDCQAIDAIEDAVQIEKVHMAATGDGSGS